MRKFDGENYELNIWPSFADIAICAMIVFLIYSLYLISMMPKQIQIGDLSDNRVEAFQEGKAVLSPEAMSIIDNIYEQVINGKYQQAWSDKSWVIVVNGHTDNVLVGKYSEFKDNWELSSARALEVVKYLQTKNIDPKRLRAIGYGEHKPIKSNDTPEGRASNRRIEIVLVKSDGRI